MFALIWIGSSSIESNIYNNFLKEVKKIIFLFYVSNDFNPI